MSARLKNVVKCRTGSYGDTPTNVTGTDCDKQIAQEMRAKGRKRCALQQILLTLTGAI
jgi:hypothetical protein